MITPACLTISYKEMQWSARIGKPKLEQETIEGTHARETPAYQRRPTTLITPCMPNHTRYKPPFPHLLLRNLALL